MTAMRRRVAGDRGISALGRGESGLCVWGDGSDEKGACARGWYLGNGLADMETEDRPGRLGAVGEERDPAFEGEKEPGLVGPGGA